MSRSIRVAVIGSGPSGMYAADALVVQQQFPAQVDVFDRLPVPFGLVRYGVAPDHTSIRSVRDTLDRILDKPGVRFLGNVQVGRDVTLDELRERYDAVILTYGASTDRHLGIPGEDLDGSVAATEFVAWYCGHPDADIARFDRLVRTATCAVVVGVGNVAIDVTRVLAKTADELEQTDMPQHVLETFAASGIRDIHLLGRRGPAQATFTTKELRELGDLADAEDVVDPHGWAFDEASEEAIRTDRTVARNVDVIREWVDQRPSGQGRLISLHFLARPIELRGDDRVREVVVERTELDGSGGVVGTGETFTIPADLVVRSVGYRGVPVPGVPFEERRGVVPNADGRVLDGDAPMAGLYVAGWIKRGPTGIIGTNKKDANATVESLLADLAADVLPEPAGPDIDGLLAERGVVVVTTAGWRAIDAAERARGASRGRERTSIHDRAELVGIAAAAAPVAR